MIYAFRCVCLHLFRNMFPYLSLYICVDSSSVWPTLMFAGARAAAFGT